MKRIEANLENFWKIRGESKKIKSYKEMSEVDNGPGHAMRATKEGKNDKPRH